MITPDSGPKDVKETEDGLRWLTILDSWLPTDSGTEDALLDELALDDGDNQKSMHSLILLHHCAYLQSGSIDIAWDDACNLFGSVCVSWNPMMFKNRVIHHGLVLAASWPTVFPTQLDLEFGNPPIYRQQDEMNVRRSIQAKIRQVA